MRRYLYLFAIVLVIVIVVLVGILIARRAGPGTEAVPTGGGTTTPGGLPVAPPATGENNQAGAGAAETTPNYEGQKFSVVAENKASDFFVNGDASVVLVQPDGQIMKAQGGQVSSLSSSPIANLIATHFSYDGKKILAVFGDRARPETSLFDVTSKTWRPLPPNMQSPAWSPVNYQIAYLGERNGSGMLFELDTSKAVGVPQEILKINLQDVQLRWIDQNQIILSDRGSALTKGSVWSLDIKNKILTPLAIDTPGLDSIWGSQYGLVFVASQSQRGGGLRLLDAAGNLLHEMAFVTLPSKCTFTTETTVTPIKAPVGTSTRASSQATSTTAVSRILYCAIPKNTEAFQAATLPDAYFRKELFTADEFYVVNLLDGKTDIIPGGKDLSVDAVNPKVFNHTLFFINRLNEQLYALSLSEL